MMSSLLDRTRIKNTKRRAPMSQKPQKPRQNTIKQYFGLTAAAVGIAVFSSAYGIWATASAQALVEGAKAGTQPALTAKNEIKAGSILDESLFETKDIPAAFRAQGAVSEIGALAGMQIRNDIAPGAQLIEANVAGSASSTDLAGAISPDKVAVAIAVDAESGFSGLIQQNNLVRVVALGNDIQGSASLETVCEQARVIALGNKLSGPDEACVSITVEVTNLQADTIRTAQSTGTVSLILLPAISQGA